MQLLEEVLRRVQIEHRERKRQRFARLLIATWTHRRTRPFEERMRHIRALDEFDDLHIEILEFLRTQADACTFPTFEAIGDAVHIAQEAHNEELLPALDRLASGYGFIHRGWNMTSIATSLVGTRNLSPEAIARKCEHTITDAGRQFLISLGEADGGRNASS